MVVKRGQMKGGEASDSQTNRSHRAPSVRIEPDVDNTISSITANFLVPAVGLGHTHILVDKQPHYVCSNGRGRGAERSHVQRVSSKSIAIIGGAFESKPLRLRTELAKLVHGALGSWLTSSARTVTVSSTAHCNHQCARISGPVLRTSHPIPDTLRSIGREICRCRLWGALPSEDASPSSGAWPALGEADLAAASLAIMLRTRRVEAAPQRRNNNIESVIHLQH